MKGNLKEMKTLNNAKNAVMGFVGKNAGTIVTVATTAALMGANTAFAADAAGLVTTAFDTIAKLILVPAVFFFLFGLFSYAQAHSEGDGPAMNKAIGKIAAGIMMVALSIILTNGLAATLAAQIG